MQYRFLGERRTVAFHRFTVPCFLTCFPLTVTSKAERAQLASRTRNKFMSGLSSAPFARSSGWFNKALARKSTKSCFPQLHHRSWPSEGRRSKPTHRSWLLQRQSGVIFPQQERPSEPSAFLPVRPSVRTASTTIVGTYGQADLDVFWEKLVQPGQCVYMSYDFRLPSKLPVAVLGYVRLMSTAVVWHSMR